jgi:Flp pilus assembly protein TadD
MADAKQLYLDGLKLFGQHRNEDALAAFEAALVQRPDWAEVLQAKATALSNLGRHADALAAIERVIELTPNDPFAFTSKSIFLQRQGRIPEAESAAAKARMLSWKEELKKNPNAPPPTGPGGVSVVQ